MSEFSIALLVSVVASVFSGEEATPPQTLADSIPSAVVWQMPYEPPELFYSVDEDTSKKKRNPNDRVGDATRQGYVSPMYLKNPSNVKVEFELSEDGKGYYIHERIGGVDMRPPSWISFEDYLEYRRKNGIAEYYREQSLAQGDGEKPGLIPTFELGEISDIFGGGTVEIRPTGYATLNFSLDRNRTDNPSLPLRQQRVTTFNFDQQIQLGVTGQIGKLMNLNFNFDTKATFDFENQLKLKWEGDEDKILQSIEAGNVSMPLGNTLIQGRSNLFGLKAGLKFGPINIIAVASTERGKVETVSIAGGGAIETPFEQEVAQYDEYRHYFLSHYFRSRYEPALVNLPQVNSTVRINRIEVWINNQRGSTTQNNRNAVGLVDLGENSNRAPNGGLGLIFNDTINGSTAVRFPDNDANDLYGKLTADPAFRDYRTAPDALDAIGMQEGLDYERVTNMRKLDNNEFSFDPQLGYISMNQRAVANQVLFVAFEYTFNGQSYQVGEFSQDVPAAGSGTNLLFLKMLKPASVKPNYTDTRGNVQMYPAWDLMMKNIYSIGYGIERQGFFLDITYNSGTSDGKLNYLPTGPIANKLLIQATELDRLTNHTAPNPDNYFDFIEGRTIIPDRGLIIFPVLEPFGDYLRAQLEPDQDAINEYVFDPLYDGTQQDAIQNFPRLNRYSLQGFYRSSGGNEIPLNAFNLQEGSVTVTANGVPLVEGSDYLVDYFGGKVTILNEALLTSGQKIDVNYESSSLYNVQSKTLLGARAEYAPTDNLTLGLTALNLSERPFTQKTTLGDEPTNNLLWGIDAAYRTESEWLTKAIDKLPLISTKQTSSIQGNVEFAQFKPGQPRQVQTERDKSNIYLDDFEAAKTNFVLSGINQWKLAAFPEDNPAVDDPVDTDPSPLARNFTRGKLAWYQIDQSFLQGFGRPNIPAEDIRDNYTRMVTIQEIFPTSRPAFGASIQPTFDLHYIPDERGHYNYTTDVDPATGKLKNPKDNWAGVTRQVTVNNDFEATNVEFLEFWMMDPFMKEPNHTGGKVYFNLGRISEDVLPDKAISLENGLPRNELDVNNIDTTVWGRVPIGLPPNQTFSNDPAERTFQDIGLDGLNNDNERSFYDSAYLRPLEAVLGVNHPAYQQALADPSTDDFLHFRDADYETNGTGILGRYLKFNGMEGNSPPGSNAQSGGNFLTLGSQEPDAEDINQNGNLSTAEEYFQYEIDLKPSAMVPGTNFIVDSIQSTVNVDNRTTEVTWFQFRIPVADLSREAINNISNLKSVDFVRMFLTGFEDSVILRLTEFQLVATQWRRFQNNYQLQPVCEFIGPAGFQSAQFEIGSVSIEENSQKSPFNYTLPPGIQRQQLNGNTQAGFLQNERSLLLSAKDLMPGDARGAFKVVKVDLRNYQRLKLWVHAEAIGDPIQANFVDTGDAACFIRLGQDNEENYYEYEMPLTPSDPFSPAPQSINNIWPESNEMDILLTDFQAAKAARDRSAVPPGEPFYYTNGLPNGHKIIVRGTPVLSDLRNIMIGARNPRPCPDEFTPIQDVDVELWINELRLTDFDKTSGWATNANFSVQGADFFTLNGSISNRTPGFGGLEQKVSERSQENTFRYDLAGNFSLGKLFPQNWGINLPMYVTYGEQKITPKFNPREPDIRTKELLESIEEKPQRDSTRREFQDYSRNQSVSFNNVRVQKLPDPNAKPDPKGPKAKMPWSAENFDFTFSYNEQLNRSAFVERLRRTQHRFVINYRYNFQPVEIKPFKAWKRKNPISLFNFNLLPNAFSMTLHGNRDFEERKMRTGSTFGGSVEPTFAKNFELARTYNLTWNLTQSLSVNFTATNSSRVDEVRGYYEDATPAEQDSVGTVWDNLFKVGRDTAQGHYNMINMGRNIGYTQNMALTYQMPFNKFTWTSWINGNVNYAGSFQWTQAPENNKALGATISNAQNLQGTGRVDLKGLYGKITPIKKLMDAIDKRAREKEQKRRAKQREKEAAKKGQTANKPAGRNPQRPQGPVAEEDTSRFKALRNIGQELLRIVFSVQSLDLSINRNANTILPGYIPATDNFGLDFRYESPFDDESFQPTGALPPTPGFVFGSQKDIRHLAGQNGWISRDSTLSNFYARNLNEQINGRTSVELFKGFRIDFNVNRMRNENFSELFRWNQDSLAYIGSDQLVNGSFNMSYIFLNTAFEKNEDFSQAFDDFDRSREEISRRLRDRNPWADSLGLSSVAFQNGYSKGNQDVLIPALLAGYSITGASNIELNNFPKIPLPNWNINYNGLNNLPFLKGVMNSFTLRHAYRATYNVSSFSNNLNAEVDSRGFVTNTETKQDLNGNDFEEFYSTDNIQSVQINEQFSPLLGVQMNFKNGVTSSIDYKKDRRLSFSTGTLQLTEQRSEDVSVMIGWRKDKLNAQFRLLGRDFDLQNSLNAQFRFTLSDNRTRNRTLDSNLSPEYTQGSFNLILEPTIDYVINTRVNIQLFFKQNITKPYTSNTYRTGFTSGGFKIRFSLAN